MFSVPVSVKNKKEMIDMFETLAHFPDTVMMLRNGDNTVDAHSLMGFFAIDEKIPIERRQIAVFQCLCLCSCPFALCKEMCRTENGTVGTLTRSSSDTSPSVR